MADPAVKASAGGKQADGQDIEQQLYAKRQKIYAREVHGVFAAMRLLAVAALLGLFYGLPWLSWDERQIVLFDLPARKFYLFGVSLFPQDFIFLALLLIIAALSLFFFTALAGRLWCGYACPQTVYTEIFMWLERKIEGDRSRQIKLDKAELSTGKFIKKGSKHLIWVLFSLWTGFTFVGYFTPILELGARFTTFDLGPWETFWIIFYGFATYGNAGWMREQVCIYMCPYARFQSAMFDKDTLIISYDEKRGEPRGSRKRNADHREMGLGDCIDCTMCVQVCPTGIDIRDGLQYQCIACAACIDACDDVMDKMGYPRGLVRYTTQHAVDGGTTHVIRARMFVYAGLLLALTAGLVYGMVTRVPLDLEIIRDRNSLFRETTEGLVENVYTLKLVNMDEHAHTFDLTASGIQGMQLISPRKEITLDAGEILGLPVQVRADPYDLPRTSSTITFTIEARDDAELRRTGEARFLGPRVR